MKKVNVKSGIAQREEAAVLTHKKENIPAAGNKNTSDKNLDPGITPVPEQKEQALRYSDDELNEFRELINSRLEIARQELTFLQGQMVGRNANGVEDSSEIRLSLEDGSGAMDREQLSQLTGRQVLYVSNLEKALIRIINKTYGVCRETGKLIDKARLRAVPHATLSMEAKTKGRGK